MTPPTSRAMLAFMLFCSAPFAFNQETQQTTEKPKEPPRRVSPFIVPAGTAIPLALKNTVNTRTAFVGQAIYCETIYPISTGSRIIIPAGSYVKGAVTQVVRAGRMKGRSQVGIRFESITLPNGTMRNMRATLASYGGAGEEGFKRDEGKVVGRSTKGEDAGKVATTATQGTVIGALSARSAKGAGLGALAGGVGGLIWVLATRGSDVVLPPGTNFELELSAPLNFEPDELLGTSRYDEGPALPADPTVHKPEAPKQ